MTSTKGAKVPLLVLWTISVFFVAQKPQKWPKMAIFGGFLMISQCHLELSNSKWLGALNHLLRGCQIAGFCSGDIFCGF